MRVVRPSGLRGTAIWLVAAISIAGCGSSAATATPEVTPTPGVTVTAVPTAELTPAPTATPTAAPTAPPATAPITAAPEISPSPMPPAATPTSGVAACTGTADIKAFLEEAASKLSFDVYCAVLPSTWWFQEGNYTLPSGGTLTITYKNAAGASITVKEGAFCASGCALAVGYELDPGSFGGLAARLFRNGETNSFSAVVGSMTYPDYLMSTNGLVSQSNFVAWSAAMRKVPKP